MVPLLLCLLLLHPHVFCSIKGGGGVEFDEFASEPQIVTYQVVCGSWRNNPSFPQFLHDRKKSDEWSRLIFKFLLGLVACLTSSLLISCPSTFISLLAQNDKSCISLSHENVVCVNMNETILKLVILYLLLQSWLGRDIYSIKLYLLLDTVSLFQVPQRRSGVKWGMAKSVAIFLGSFARGGRRRRRCG